MAKPSKLAAFRESENGAALLILIVGVLVSWFAFTAVRGWEDQRATDEFSHLAHQHTDSIERRLFGAIEAVQSIAALYAASKEVLRSEFSKFTKIEMEDQPNIQALEWIPRVEAPARALFESRARGDGLAGFSFVEREAQGTMVPARERATYYPVYFVEPVKGNEAAIGFDLGSNPARLAALEKARDTGEITATERITLVQEKGNQYGILVFQPIYVGGEVPETISGRREKLAGFGLGVLRVGDLLIVAMDTAFEQGTTYVFDRSAPAGKQRLFPKNSPYTSPADLKSKDCVFTTMGVGGRDWAVIHCPEEAASFSTLARQSWIILFAGLFISLVLAAYTRLITIQRNAAQVLSRRLARSEARYSDIVDNTRVLIQSMDIETGNFIFTNQGWHDALGYSRTEVGDLDFKDILHPDSLEHCKEVLQKAISTKEPQDVDAQFLTKSGAPLFVEGHIVCRQDEDGALITHGVFTDVTSRTEATAERERLLHAIENLDESVVLFDAEDRIVFCNEAFRALSADIVEFTEPGTLFEDHLRAGVRAGLMPDGIGREDEWVEERLRLHRNPAGPLQVSRQNGMTILVNEQILPDGGIVLVISDLTALKQSQAQVVQASKLATLGEMATSVAHELNQPLNVIRMAAGNSRRRLGKGTADPEYLDEKLQRIEDQTARAAAIIDHMRMFGRRAEEDAKPIEPGAAMASALDLMREQLRLSGIAIHAEIAEDCPAVMGHAIQLEQVLLNLLSNARDAIESNGGDRMVSLRVLEENNAVVITIEDSGGGIPEPVLPRIFEPFYTTKEIGKGTGLGLSVSYGIIRDMGGSIVAENHNGGARFTISLPALAENEAIPKNRVELATARDAAKRGR